MARRRRLACLCGETTYLSEAMAMDQGWRSGTSPRAGVARVVWDAQRGRLMNPGHGEYPLRPQRWVEDGWWCPSCVVSAGREPVVGARGHGGVAVWLGGIDVGVVSAEPAEAVIKRQVDPVELYVQAWRAEPVAVAALREGTWLVTVRELGSGVERTRPALVRAGVYSHVWKLNGGI